MQRLASRPEGQLFVAYLREAHEHTRDQLEAQPDAVMLRVAQGRSQILGALLKLWKP